jgi:hypothetical protein
MAQQNTGLLLARLIKRHNMSIPKVADFTGATRATVYNWCSGKGVSPAYRAVVLKLIARLQAKDSK